LTDLIVVGAGLTGATIARMAAEQDFKVLVLERRSEIGGNVADTVHESGIRYNLHGPHYFRTNSPMIWGFVNRFAVFKRYEAVLMTNVVNAYYPYPPHMNWTVERPLVGGEATNFEAACLQKMGPLFYDLFIKHYTKKQWGVDPTELDAGLASRVELRTNGELRLKDCKYQGIPTGGYTELVYSMLTHTKIDVETSTTCYLTETPMVYTGCIDELLGFRYGRLRYRTQKREHIFHPNVGFLQPAVQINYPTPDVPYIRRIEWKHLPHNYPTTDGTLITTEFPQWATSPDECEYPFPSYEDRQLYEKYRDDADSLPNFIVCGRLGFYRYLDMDMAIGSAMNVFRDKVLPMLKKAS